MKYTALFIIALFLFSFTAFSQQEMTYPAYESSFSEAQKKEQAAKEQIAEEQAKITSLKDEIKGTKKKQEQTRAESFTLAGTATEQLEQWNSNLNALLNQVDAFNALAAQDKITRQAEVTGFETQTATLKQDHAALFTASQAQLSVLETAVTSARNGIAQATKDVAAAADAAKLSAMDEKKRKIEEARMAKEEAKRKAEEEKQVKLDAKQKAQEEAKQKAEEEKQAKAAAREQAKAEREQKAEEAKQARAQTAENSVGGDDLVAGSVYKVKDVPGNRETLSKMALRLYGDPKLWTKIYDANKEKIDAAYEALKRRTPDAKYKEAQDYIYPGLNLVIPK